MLKVIFLGGSAIAAAALGARPAWSDPMPAVAARNSGDQVEEVVVTARRIEENLQKIPVSVTPLSAQVLTRANFRSIRDIAGLAPNLNIRQDPNGQQGEVLSLRGQAPPDTVLSIDPAVAIYGDNVLLPRSYGLHNAMIDVDRIEVLRGPQGTLYGKNTDGGAVGIITTDPKTSLGASLNGTYGNYNTWDIRGILNIPVSDNAGLRFVVDRSHNGSYGTNALGQGLGWDDDIYIRGKFKGAWGPLAVRAFVDYNNDRNGGALDKLAGLIPASGGNPAGGSTTKDVALVLFGASNASTWPGAIAALTNYIGGDPFQSGGTLPTLGTNNAHDAGLDISYDLTTDVKIRSITGYRWLNFRAPADLDGTPFTVAHTHRGADDTFYSEELQLLGGHSTFNWVTGFYYSAENGRELSTSQVLAALTPPIGVSNITNGDIKSSSWALFGQFNWQFAPRLSLTGGIRYTSENTGLVSYNRRELNGVLVSCSVPAVLLASPGVCQSQLLSKTFSEPTWTGSITYGVTSDISTYFKASHGFRSGGQNYRGAVSVESFQSFLPETVNEYEIGLKSELFDRRVRLNLAAFQDDMSNVQRSIIIQVPSIGTTATVVTNAATARIDGFEAEGTWRLSRRLTLNGSVGLIDPRYLKFSDFTGDRSQEAWPTPRMTYYISAAYVQPTSVGDLTGTLTWAGQSDQNLAPASKLAGQVTQPGYGLLNGRLSLDIPSADVTVAFFGRNILNKAYYVQATGFESIGYNLLVVGEPRTFGVEIVKRFGGI